MVQSGVQRAFGPNLRRILGAALGNRAATFLAGLGRQVLQSSTATGLMVTGLLAGGLVDLTRLAATCSGRPSRTTLIVQVLSLDISAGGATILIGVMVFRRGALPAPAISGVSASASG